MLPFDVFQQTFRRRMDQVENVVKSGRAAVVRVWDFRHLAFRCKLQKQPQSLTVGRLAFPLHVAQIVAVHRKYIVEYLIVGMADLTCAESAEFDAALTGSNLRTRIRGLAGVGTDRTRRVDSEPVEDAALFRQTPEHALRRGTSADVSHADKQYANSLRIRFHTASA